MLPKILILYEAARFRAPLRINVILKTFCIVVLTTK